MSEINETLSETLSKKEQLNIAIGQQVAEFLNLKFDREGLAKTKWGTKTVKGLGACIARIVEEQTQHLSD